MIINHNMAALNANRMMNINSTSASKAMEKLSSGLRINRAGDAAAGLAISEKMRGQINGLNQASSNAQDGISLVQTAEGNLNETESILQRMRELATQAANDTETDQDRKNIQAEMTQLENEIDRIGNQTQFNTKNLLDGSMGATTTKTASVDTSSIINAVSSGSIVAAGTTKLLTDLTDASGNSLGIEVGDKVTVSYVKNGVTSVTTLAVSSTSKLGDLVFRTSGGTTEANLSVNGTTSQLILTAAASGVANAIVGVEITVKDSGGNTKTAATDLLSSFTETTAAADDRGDGSATFQIGANTDQNLNLSINDMRAAALGVKDLKVDSQANANIAMKVIDNATQKVSAERGKLGAIENRLEHTINNLGTSSENLTSAESRIRDVDMAQEMSEYSKDNILSQAAQAMLAQANQQPQQVLQLLR